MITTPPKEAYHFLLLVTLVRKRTQATFTQGWSNGERQKISLSRRNKSKHLNRKRRILLLDLISQKAGVKIGLQVLHRRVGLDLEVRWWLRKTRKKKPSLLILRCKWKHSTNIWAEWKRDSMPSRIWPKSYSWEILKKRLNNVLPANPVPNLNQRVLTTFPPPQIF